MKRLLQIVERRTLVLAPWISASLQCALRGSVYVEERPDIVSISLGGERQRGGQRYLVSIAHFLI